MGGVWPGIRSEACRSEVSLASLWLKFRAVSEACKCTAPLGAARTFANATINNPSATPKSNFSYTKLPTTSMAPPTDHGTGPPQGHAITPPGATTSTGSITPKGATTPTGSVAPTDTAPYPFFVEYGSFKRASPEDRIRVAEIDGDIALNFISPTGQTEIIASTKILSEASLVFRKMLAPGPRDRIYTNEKPQVTQIEDWHLLPGVLQLCLVLHGKADKVIEKEDDGTLMLLRFAQVAKKFRAVEFLKPAISPKLLEPFVKRASERDDNSFRTDTDLATIAYLLDQEQMFSLFTRRLLMDHCKPLSSCASDLFKTINPYYICKFIHILTHSEPKLTSMQCNLRNSASPPSRKSMTSST